MFNNYLYKFVNSNEKGIDHVKNQRLGFDKKTGRLRYMQITGLSTVKASDPPTQKIPVKDSWDQLAIDFSETAPPGLANVYQEAGVFWAWMVSEEEFFRGAKSGVTISGALAFIILLLSTGNILISIYALMSVAFIVVCVMAMMVILGWELGVSESTAIIIIIGFSVDYVVHLAAHYLHTPMKFRYDRTTDSIAAMGVSIVSGGITTLGSGAFLFGC